VLWLPRAPSVEAASPFLDYVRVPRGRDIVQAARAHNALVVNATATCKEFIAGKSKVRSTPSPTRALRELFVVPAGALPVPEFGGLGGRESERWGFRVGDGARGRFATPTKFPRHDCSPYQGLYVRRDSSGFPPRSRAIFCRPFAKPYKRYDSQLFIAV
jgi:hypothetical protein